MRAGRGRGMERPKWMFLRRFDNFRCSERRNHCNAPTMPRAELAGIATAAAENEDDAEQGNALSSSFSVLLDFESRLRNTNC